MAAHHGPFTHTHSLERDRHRAGTQKVDAATQTLSSPWPGRLSSAPGGFCHPSAGLALWPAAVSLFLAALGPFPSLHRNDSSLLSSPAGAAGGLAGRVPTGPRRGPLTWQPPHHEPQTSGQGVQALGCSLVSPVPTLAGHGARGGGGRTCRPCCTSGHAHLMCAGGIWTGKTKWGWGFAWGCAKVMHTVPDSPAGCSESSSW